MKTILRTLVCIGAVASTGSAAAQSQAYCDSYARDYARTYSDGREVLGGAALGALGGAAIGGIARGNRGLLPGAAIGGGVGAVAGAATHANRYQDAYNHAYYNCMNAPRASYGAPQPGTPDWHAYCASKYRSYRPDTGMYLAHSGQWRYCR